MIKEKIEEIQKYFKDKIRNWEFDIKDISNAWIKIKVDWDFTFTMYYKP